MATIPKYTQRIRVNTPNTLGVFLTIPATGATLQIEQNQYNNQGDLSTLAGTVSYGSSLAGAISEIGHNGNRISKLTKLGGSVGVIQAVINIARRLG